MYKVLLADDEPSALEALRLAVDWEECGYLICGECSNGEEALKTAKSLQPDLIVTDIRMPVMDGLELVRQVSADLPAQAEYILVSGYDEFEYAKRAIKYGVRHYVLKPVLKEEFSGVLAEVSKRLKQRDRLKGLADGERDIEAEEYFAKILSDIPAERPEFPGKKDGSGSDRLHGGYPESIGLMGTEKGLLWVYAILDPYPAGKNSDKMHCSSTINCSILKSELSKPESQYAAAYITLLAKGSFGLVLCFGKDFQMDDLGEALEKDLTRIFSRDFYLVISDAADSPAHLGELSRQASAAWGFRFFKPAGSIFFHKDCTSYKMNYNLDCIEDRDAIYDALENLDGDRLSSSVQTVFEEFRRTMSAPEIVEIYSTNVVYKGLELIRSMGGTVEEVAENYPAGMLNFAGLSLDDTRAMLLCYCEDVRKYLCRLKLEVQQSDMLRVKDFISGNYKTGITIREMSMKLYIHPAYLGHLIRKWFGCSFNEYIHKLRIEEAKRLLSETDRKAGDIAAEVGYTAYGAFLQQFEKNVLMKPVDFRAAVKTKK